MILPPSHLGGKFITQLQNANTHREDRIADNAGRRYRELISALIYLPINYSPIKLESKPTIPRIDSFPDTLRPRGAFGLLHIDGVPGGAFILFHIRYSFRLFLLCPRVEHFLSWRKRGRNSVFYEPPTPPKKYANLRGAGRFSGE